MADIRKRLSYANVMATLAVFFVLGGGAYALSANSVGTKQLKNKAVTNKKIKKKTIKNSRVKKENLKGNRIKDGSLTEKEIADGTLTGAKIADGSIGDAKLSDLEVLGDSWVRATATTGATEAAARAAAPKIPLGGKGQLSIYAKCFREPGPIAFAEVYVETSAAGSIFDSAEDSKGGGPAASDFLNPNTPEDQRRVAVEDAGGNDVDSGGFSFVADSPDGTAISGIGFAAVKEGNLAGGNGIYGAGNVCLFSGFAAG